MINATTLNDSDICSLSFPEGKYTTLNGKLLIAAYSLAMVFIALANSTLVIGLLKTKQSKARAHQFFLIVGFCDLFIGAVLLPLQIYMINIKAKASCSRIAVQCALCNFFVVCSAILMLGVGFDRYFLVVKIDFYTKHNNKMVTRSYAAFAFIVSSAMAIFVGCSVYFTNKYLLAAYQITFSLLLVSLAALTLITNTAILRHVHGTARLMRQYSATAKYTFYDGKATQTIRWITFALVLTYLPAIVAALLCASMYLKYVGYHGSMDRVSTAMNWSIVPIFFNAGMNSLIFISRNDLAKKYFKSLFNRGKNAPSFKGSLDASSPRTSEM